MSTTFQQIVRALHKSTANKSTPKLHCAAMHPIILLCLTPDDFTCQGQSAGTHWDNLIIFPCV
jgi:hypothetical protein